MPAARYYCPLDSLEQKLQIERRLGSVKASKYFSLFRRFLSLKISKCEFDRLCIATIGRDVIPLHNHFVRSILKKACTPKAAPPPTKSTVDSSWNAKMPNGCNDFQILCKDIPQSPRKGRTPNLRERRFKDRPSPLGSHGKSSSIAIEDLVPKINEQQSNVELQSVSGRLPLYVEDGEEVDQDLEILNNHIRSPIVAPLGIPIYNGSVRRISSKGLVSSTTAGTGQLLPDTCSLKKRLEQELEKEKLNISLDATNLLNKALDVYLKRLIKPCLDLAVSKSVNKFSAPIQPGLNRLQPMKSSVQNSIGGASASISDLQTAMELDPSILGENWTLHLEKVSLGASKERVGLGSTLY